MSKSFMFAVENAGNDKFVSLPKIEEQINSGHKILEETQADYFFNATRFENATDFKYVSEDGYKTLLNEGYNEIYNLLKHGSNTVEVLAENVTHLNSEDGDQFFNLYDRGLQIDGLNWGSVEEEYGKVDLSVLVDVLTNNYEINPTEKELVGKEANKNQINIDCIKSSLDALEGDEDEFWSMIEAGIGTAMDFSESVEFVKNWIEQNGNWGDNSPHLEIESHNSLTFDKDLLEAFANQEEVETLSVDLNANTTEENNLHALADEIAVNYSIIKKADCKYEVYFYIVDDINGTVKGVAPTDSGYVNAALSNIIFPKFSNSDSNIESGTLQFDAGSLIVPLVIEKGNVKEVQNGNAKVYFSYAGASGGDGLDRIKLIDGNVFGFNSQLDKTDNDVNDIIIKLDNLSI